MEEQRTDHRAVQAVNETAAQESVKPAWQDQQMTCKKCRYCGQDIDSYPCDRCHTGEPHAAPARGSGSCAAG